MIMQVMSRAGIATIKAHFSEYLARVRAGEEIVVTDRGRPVARLAPIVDESRVGGDESLNDLERAGVIRVARTSIAPAFWDHPTPQDPEAAVRRALIEDRLSGR